MKTMKAKLIPIIALVMSMMACDKIVYIRIDEGDQKIVLNGLINPDSTVIVHVARTRQVHVTGPIDSIDLLPDSIPVDDISLYENDQLVGHLTYRWKHFYELPGFRPSAGKIYRIEASSGEMDPVSATMTIPENIPVDSFDTTHIILENGGRAIRISFRFTDPAAQENYYALQVTGLQRYYDHQYQKFLDDSLFAYNYSTRFMARTDGGLFQNFLEVNKEYYLNNLSAQPMVFTDELFNGKTLDVELTYPEDYYIRMDKKVLFRVDLMQVDKSYYQYAVSDTKFREVRNNPFAEPVQVFTNVKNGFGLFSAYNGSHKEFLMDWDK
jgi:hypothetical protein